MKLGLNRDEVRLEDHNKEWKSEFFNVKQDILNNTSLKEARIEHIGSTAITDMPAKPIIDIIVGVDELDKVDKQLLKGLYQAGFLRLKVERPGEIVLAKFTDDTYDIKTNYIHIVEYQKDLWKNLIFFRDYLNSNSDAKEEYLELKKEYIRKSTTGITEYTNHKEKFVKTIYEKRNIK